jgi:hypothetical protein
MSTCPAEQGLRLFLLFFFENICRAFGEVHGKDPNLCRVFYLEAHGKVTPTLFLPPCRQYIYFVVRQKCTAKVLCV